MRHASFLVLVVLSVTACQKVLGFEEFEEGTAASGGSSGGGGTAGAAGAAGAGPCTGGPGDMVGLRRPNGKCMFIDPYEVTREQYQAYVTTNPTRPSGCESNTDLATPEETQLSACTTSAEADAGADAGSDAGAPDPKLPMTCVDWCDAAGFCAYQGKTLCKGERLAPKDPNQSAWYMACAGADKWGYPYGAQYQAAACNESCTASCALAAPGTFTSCKTPEGVYDLAGNAGEWVDECTSTSADAECHQRGGTLHDTSSAAWCEGAATVKKKIGLPNVGFRCCWEPS